MANATIQIRTDAEVKEAADFIFNRLGITMSDGINIFLRQVQIHQGFPFDIRLATPAGKNADAPVEESRAHIRTLAGKYNACKFGTERYFENKRRDKELEN
jgi:addiction module RelB/DinJ family antitoxin